MFGSTVSGLPSVLGVISAMITPAILILATGMLRAEIAHALGDDWHSALDDEGPGESARASTIVG